LRTECALGGLRFADPPYGAPFISEVVAWIISRPFLPGLCSAIASPIWPLDCAARLFRHRSPILAAKALPPPSWNFLWGAFNLLVGVYLLSRHPVTVDFEPGFLALVLGALTIGIYLSLHFGKVRQDRSGS
jgi:hypothetical protein